MKTSLQSRIEKYTNSPKPALAFCFLFLLLAPVSLFSQNIYVHPSNESLYAFLDEMNTNGFIDINTSVKPYSRIQIARWLDSLAVKKEQLNQRQARELDFYLRDFNKELQPGKDFKKRLDLFYRKDSLFSLSVNPIGGIQYWNNANGTAWHRWNGAEAFAYIGNGFGFYASLRDNHESLLLNDPDYLTRRTGAAYKSGNDYSEMRGGITYTWKWGQIGLVKDHFQWGSGYNGTNIFSGRTPSFASLKLNLKPADWFEFNYFHGWLASEVVDSSRTWSYVNVDKVSTRTVYKEKYIAANFFTFKPFRDLYVSFGNSIIYSDLGIEPAYLIPLFFFKSVDHTLNHEIDNQNSQMFFDISSTQIKHLHLYTSLFVDEISISRMFNSENHSNFISWKAGGRLSDLWVPNTAFTMEYTRTNPLTFRHYIPVLTFASNEYNLGHYLQDNATEMYLSMEYRPVRGLSLKAAYLHARKGPDYTSITTQRQGLPFMESVEWENQTLQFDASWQVLNDGYFFFQFQYSKISGDQEKYNSELYYGSTRTVSMGLNFGF